MKKSIFFNSLITTCLIASFSTISLAREGHHGPRDTDGDGLISQQEALDHAEQRFNIRDQDGDGVITLDEVLSKASERFEQRDLDQDGFISHTEHRQGRSQRPSRPIE